MQVIKSVIIAAILLVCIWFFNSYSIQAGAKRIPPLGKLLNPINGFWANAVSEDKLHDETLQIKGLKAPVTIIYDEHMVPHIYAQNEEDLYKAQGYVTARFRLWQMELQTHAAAGRISELLGEKMLSFDRLKRRTGLKYGAMQTVKAIEADPAAKVLLDAYTDGINQYIASLTQATYPLEYKLLNYKPEPWTNVKTGLLLKAMAETLTALEFDIEHTQTLEMLGTDQFNFLYREWWDEQDPIVPKGTLFTSAQANVNSTSTSHELVTSSVLDKKNITEFLNEKEDGYQVGSNNWAISGSKTKSGKPILANDPHLRLSLPSIWFQIHLSCPEYNTCGVSLPGAPGVIIGFNDSIAWGVTNAGRDIRDWYTITYKDATRNEYVLDGKYVPTKKVIEEFKIKNGKSFFDTIVYTHHGPVVYDASFNEKQLSNLALRWTAHDMSKEMLTFNKLNKAKNIDDYFEAIADYACPAQNFVFASKRGDIAIQQQGKFPIERKGQSMFVQDGSTSENDWKAYIPSSQNPHMINPPRGFVSSANQHPTDPTYPYAYSGVFEYNRNRRINRRLTEMNAIDIAAVRTLQLDNYNMQAEDILPKLLQSLDTNTFDAKQKYQYQKLTTWNYMNDPELLAPSIFEMWKDTLKILLWDEFYLSKKQVRIPEEVVLTHMINDMDASPFFDIKYTSNVETKQDLIVMSFKAACAKALSMRYPSWTVYKHTTIEHLAKLPAFTRDYVACGGNKNIVNATSKYHAPSWRMIVELTEPIQAIGIYPGGQVGNPGSKYYDNFIDDWSKGIYYPIYYSASIEEMLKHKVYQIQLKP